MSNERQLVDRILAYCASHPLAAADRDEWESRRRRRWAEIQSRFGAEYGDGFEDLLDDYYIEIETAILGAAGAA